MHAPWTLYPVSLHVPICNDFDQIELFRFKIVNTQYHGCWCPGSLSRQDISILDIYYVEYVVSSCLTWGKTSTTCIKSVWRNDRFFILLMKNQAGKWLIQDMYKKFVRQICESRNVQLLPQWINIVCCRLPFTDNPVSRRQYGPV